MPKLRDKQRLSFGLGMLLFLLSCAYVPWERRIYQSVGVHGADTETHLEYHLSSPPETHYGWVFCRPVTPKSPVFAVPGVVRVEISAEVNIQLLLVEWLGICLFTGGLMLLLRPAERC